jgi:hypothetical protein
MVIGLTSSAATVEYKFQSGPCEGKSDRWWSVTTITDGVPTHITGTDCNGYLYDRELTPRVVPNDPIIGLTPTLTGNCGTLQWKALTQYNDTMYPIWMGGQACDGTYWVIDAFDPPAPGAPDGLQ